MRNALATRFARLATAQVWAVPVTSWSGDTWSVLNIRLDGVHWSIDRCRDEYIIVVTRDGDPDTHVVPARPGTMPQVLSELPEHVLVAIRRWMND